MPFLLSYLLHFVKLVAGSKAKTDLKCHAGITSSGLGCPALPSAATSLFTLFTAVYIIADINSHLVNFVQ